MFDVLFYLFCSIACFRPVDRQVESEPSENFQDINFEDLEQASGIRRQVSLTHIVPIFLYLSIGLHAGSY
jgi:hypothetical protein